MKAFQAYATRQKGGLGVYFEFILDISIEEMHKVFYYFSVWSVCICFHGTYLSLLPLTVTRLWVWRFFSKIHSNIASFLYVARDKKVTTSPLPRRCVSLVFRRAASPLLPIHYIWKLPISQSIFLCSPVSNTERSGRHSWADDVNWSQIYPALLRRFPHSTACSSGHRSNLFVHAS